METAMAGALVLSPNGCMSKDRLDTIAHVTYSDSVDWGSVINQIDPQNTFSHCYNVIMDMRRKEDSFGLSVETGGRYVKRIECFKPGRLTDSSIGVCVIRLEFTVSVVETPPGEPDGEDLDGQGIQIIANAVEPVS